MVEGYLIKPEPMPGFAALEKQRLAGGAEAPPLQGIARDEELAGGAEAPLLQGIARDEEFEGAGHDGEFDGKAGEGLAVNLSVDRILVERFAHQRISFPEMNALCPAKIAHPEGWQITQIAKSALRREGHDLELISEEVRTGGDLEWPAVVCGAADDNQGGVGFLAADDDAKVRKLVTEDFAGTLPPIGENAEAGFEIKTEGINNHATGAADAEEEFFLFRLSERRGQAKSDFLHFAMNQPFRGAGNVPGQVQFLCENIGGSTGKKSERGAAAVFLSGQAVDDFIQRAVAAAGNHELTTFGGGAPRDVGGIARCGGFSEFCFDAAQGKDAPRGVEVATPAAAGVTGVRVVNQQRVAQFGGHPCCRGLPFVT